MAQVEKTLWIFEYLTGTAEFVVGNIVQIYAKDEAEAIILSNKWLDDHNIKRRPITLRNYPGGFLGAIRLHLPGKIVVEEEEKEQQ